MAPRPDPRRLIARIRAGLPLDPTEVQDFALGLADGRVSDAQAGAFAMAVVLKGLGEEGRIALTRGMRDSGSRLQWDLPGPVIDKHSTGGVGDCVSLLLAPALAACGAYVPMISGRGLGHTGGTLDKLEAIPGFKVDLSAPQLSRQMAKIRCAIVAATEDLAPADRRLYALRDETGTVDSIDLITASILSKKLAAGLEGLVLDVKCGAGAFMKSLDEARALAQALVKTAQGAGCMTTALITDMSQPLASAAGNALEIIEVMQTLTGSAVNGALWEVTCALGGEALALGGLADDARDGAARIAQALEHGAAAEVFGQMVVAQGGPADFVERWPDRLPAAPIMVEVPSLDDGYVSFIDTTALGEIVVRLGGGRLRAGDRINPAVGLSALVPLGLRVSRGSTLAMVHANSQEAAEAAAAWVQAAYRIGTSPSDDMPLIMDRIS